MTATRDAGRPDGANVAHGARRGLAITARGVTLAFGAATVLRDLDLHVPAGQFLAVIGRSGGGKSTLLRLLSGLDEPSAGRVSHAGYFEGEGGRARIRIMFQEPRLLPWARVLANVEIGLGAARGPRGRVRSRDALRDVGLEARAGEWPSVLSGGQQQRVALARALVSSPGFLALDEPLGALDALTRIEMQGLIEEAWLRDGFTAVLVTHDVPEALALGDRVVLIEDGTIALDLPVPLPRPRRRDTPEFAALEGRLLRRLLGDEGPVSAP